MRIFRYIAIVKFIVVLTKKKMFSTIKQLPDHFSIDDLLDGIMVLQKIETGTQQPKDNMIYSTVQAQNKLKRWLK